MEKNQSLKKRFVFALCLLIFSVFNLSIFAQVSTVVVSGIVQDSTSGEAMSFARVSICNKPDSSFIAGVICQEDGSFILEGIKPGGYLISISQPGYNVRFSEIYVGSLSPFLDLGILLISGIDIELGAVLIEGKQDVVSSTMDKKTVLIDENISQSGGSVLQVLQNVPGVGVEDGKVSIRGSDKVIVLIDGKQTAITGYGSQSGLDHIPASSIEKIEIINNPSSKYDANGNAGIINIIYKKEKKDGFNGKVGLAAGLGALWIRKQNFPGIRSQYQATPKLNPSISLNYRKNEFNIFLQSDYLYTETLNKNEFTNRYYDDGTIIRQQLKRNRDTQFLNNKLGADWNWNEQNQLTIAGGYGLEIILDRGDEPFYNSDLTQLNRLWKFLEDEVKTTVTGNLNYLHKFRQPGRTLSFGYLYTFHREDEKYFFDNILPEFSGKDAFKLISDEQVSDFSLDYVKPMKFGKIESGLKFRLRDIPTNMKFIPGVNSPLDSAAGGWATYRETIPAGYINYLYENEHLQVEGGLRTEYVKVDYLVNPDHPTYKSNGYQYFQPFPSLRFAYKLSDEQRLSVFFNRRVDRPNEVDIRIFPKYDDAEIIKVGNPELQPQYTNSVEAAFRKTSPRGYFYFAAYHRFATSAITRIAVVPDSSTLIYAVFQNAGKSFNSGVESMLSYKVNEKFDFNVNLNAYRNQINAFDVTIRYPETALVQIDKQSAFSGNAKLNVFFHFKNGIEIQAGFIYYAPDIIPQGRIAERFSMDAGIRKKIQKGKAEVFLNGTDLFNSMIIRKTIDGVGFHYTSSDYYETQVFRLGYSFKF